MIGFDVLTILFFIVSATVPGSGWILALDAIIGVILAAELAARAVVANRTWRFLLSFGAIVDLIVIISLMMPLLFENLAFLRVVRMLRSYHLLRELRQEWPFFRRNEELIRSAINLVIFVFTVTAVVFVLEEDQNANINNYFDALYFTVTTLTTTGFGDINLTDTLGRALAVVIMVFGVAPFLRLVQTLFRPPKTDCVQVHRVRPQPPRSRCRAL